MEMFAHRVLLGTLLLALALNGAHANSSDQASGKTDDQAKESSQSVVPGNPACLPPASWALLSPGANPVQSNVMETVNRLLDKEVVLLGEQHDDEDHHRWQLQVLAGLFAQRPQMAIGLEAFPRRLQPALDRWVAGELSVKDFVEQSEWEKIWNVPIWQYLPIFHFARINRIPLIALNVESSLNKAVIAKGWAAIPEAQREGVSTPAKPLAAYRNFLFGIFQQHRPPHGKGAAAVKPNDPAFARFVESQTLWDRAMAEGLGKGLAALPAQEKPVVVGIMGSGHVRFGHGVPHQLAALGISKVGTLLPVPQGAPCADLPGDLATGVFVIPDLPRVPPEPPRLGVSLDRDDQGVRILEVKAGSLAEGMGLLKGDRILVAAGQGMPSVSALISLIRGTPSGAWLPLIVRRGDEMIEMLIKFPPKP